MARTEIPVYTINRVEYVPETQVPGDVANGLFFADNQGYTFIEVENSGTQPWTVGGVIADNTVDLIPIPNKDLDVNPGSVVKMGPFPTRYYSQDNRDVYIDPESSDLLFRAFTTQ